MDLEIGRSFKKWTGRFFYCLISRHLTGGLVDGLLLAGGTVVLVLKLANRRRGRVKALFGRRFTGIMVQSIDRHLIAIDGVVDRRGRRPGADRLPTLRGRPPDQLGQVGVAPGPVNQDRQLVVRQSLLGCTGLRTSRSTLAGAGSTRRAALASGTAGRSPFFAALVILLHFGGTGGTAAVLGR